jgi:hypothetical protein
VAATKTTKLVTQPPFAPQIQSLPSPMGVPIPLQRGYMIWERTIQGYTGGPLNDGRDMINFLFNPSTVTADYNVMMTNATAALQYQMPADMGNVNVPLSQTVSWDLYFDRTFELNYGGNSSAVNDPAVIGVQADVYQFLQFTGVTYDADVGNAATNASTLASVPSALSNQVQGSLRSGGTMRLIPCFVFFGNALQQMSGNSSNTNLNAVNSQVQYYGYISEFTINYTHWTVNMVPIRAVISVYFTMMPNTNVNNNVTVWRDLEKLHIAAPTAPVPYAPGYNPPPVTTGTTFTVGGR